MRKVPNMTALDIGFGNINHLPLMEEIPDKFKELNTPQNRFIGNWFFLGMKLEEMNKLIPKEGVDKKMAIQAIQAILRSWEPKHEHKEAGCAYLLSEWFEELK
jgi:hypothetical protein